MGYSSVQMNSRWSSSLKLYAIFYKFVMSTLPSKLALNKTVRWWLKFQNTLKMFMKLQKYHEFRNGYFGDFTLSVRIYLTELLILQTSQIW